MSRSLVLMLGGLALAFGAGLAAGLSWGASAPAAATGETASPSGSVGSTMTTEAQSRVEANTLLSSRIRELEKQLATLKADHTALVADRMAFFKKYHGQINLRPFDNSLSITPEMVDLLGITKEEKAAVEHQLKQAADAMEKLVEARTVLLKQTADSVTYQTPAIPEGKDLKDQLAENLRGDLGPDRAELFDSFPAYDDFGPLAGFGQDQTDVEIKATTDNGKQQYTYRVSTPHGSMSSTSSSVLPAVYRKYAPAGQNP